MLIPFRDGRAEPPLGATLFDISETGALLELGYELHAGTPVALFIESGPADTALRAVVLHCRGTTGYMAQLEFVAEQPGPAREALRRSIDDARVDSGRSSGNVAGVGYPPDATGRPLGSITLPQG